MTAICQGLYSITPATRVSFGQKSLFIGRDNKSVIPYQKFGVLI